MMFATFQNVGLCAVASVCTNARARTVFFVCVCVCVSVCVCVQMCVGIWFAHVHKDMRVIAHTCKYPC